MSQQLYRAVYLFIVVIIVTIFTSAAAALPSGTEEARKNDRTKNMVYIPAGYFTMGNDEQDEDEAPAHKVFLDAYFIDTYEVSNAEYDLFLKETGHKKPKYWDDQRYNASDQPVVGVTWHDAYAYAQWVGKRLPTEAEWEKAARGEDMRNWTWGNTWTEIYTLYYLNTYGEQDNYQFTAPVNYYEAGISPFGVMNMAGNLWEWCNDWYNKDFYKHRVIVNPKGPRTGTMKVLRGGSWVNSIEGTRVSQRMRNYPDVSVDMYGFRLALTPEEE